MPLIQLEPHLFSALPAHSLLSDHATRPPIQESARSALREALELLQSVPSALTTDPKPRASSPSTAKVKLLRGWSSQSKLTPDKPNAGASPEFWVFRQSEHANSKTDGTASWGEFEEGLREDHAEHEMQYTPSMTGLESLLTWSREDIGDVEVEGIHFRDIDAEVNLITHSFHPSALIVPRSFISFTFSASYTRHDAAADMASSQPSPQGFITAQIPLRPDPTSTPPEMYQRILSSVPRRAVFANYASVERVALLPGDGSIASTAESAQNDRDGSRIEWTMGTTSDAGGSIPQWVQRSWTMGGVPRAVVADVGLFLGWVAARRNQSP